MPTPRRVFYGWYVVAATLVTTTATSGLVFYSLSILLAAFVSEYGFPVRLASAAMGTFFIAGGIGGMIAGRLVDRFDVRFVMTVGAVLAAVALAALVLLREVWQLFAFHLVFGLAHGCMGLVPVTTVIARWFHVRRSLALSIGSTGLSLGGVVVAPLVALGVEGHGLAGAAPWMALAVLVGIVPVTLLVLRPSPQSMGLHPDGATRTEIAQAPPPLATSYRDARRSPYFLAVSAAYLFLLGSQVGALMHFYRLVSTRDGAATAALALAVLAACSTIGRLGGGALLLKVPARTFAITLMAMQALGLAILAVSYGPAAILAATVVFALTIGNSLMMHPLLLAERFGTREYGRIYALSQMVTVVGLAGCPALIGLVYDWSGGYELPFLLAAAATLVGLAILVLFATGRPVPATAA
jgi:MFS family permease